MNTTISFFISYIDALFPEGDIPSVDGAIDYCEIGKFIEMPPRKNFSEYMKPKTCDVFDWFSPGQFFYYFPELMKCSLKKVGDYDEFSWYEEFVWRIFSSANNTPASEAYLYNEKWALFSNEQLLAVRLWLQILKPFLRDAELYDLLTRSIENLELKSLMREDKK